MRGSPLLGGDCVLTAFTIAPCMPSATSWVNSTLICLEACRLEAGLVLGLGERAGDAADVGAALRAIRRRQPVFGDDVADADPSAGLEYPA